MSAQKEAESQGDCQREPIYAGYLVLTAVFLGVALAIFGEFAERYFEPADGGVARLVGIIVAPLTMCITAPRKAKQLGLIAVIVAAGGVLALVPVIVGGQMGWGIWGALLGMGVGCGLGCGLIALCYKRLGIPIKGQSDAG